ncbi:hypothetical protein DNJ95_13355 [Stutzerimonas kirkiae]|uniref:Uncharacterized protein n=1 Tax=Stutzerimonas kirkiae TaxID=2211392 RepID=A0A4Q9RCW6_9GAMM|nr:hypothetical protein DNJ96_05485 [Stutzerimonas kirkiae]TBV00919.1 hypothetical protein DNJ95_13355 [Stutzerimonas kirkiae]TBV07730.1 hypothetical protein DNK08_11910 [Stutzerimonas kirkiae]
MGFILADRHLQKPVPLGGPDGYGLRNDCAWELRQGSGVHTHRQVIAGPVCQGIIMCGSDNTMPRQTALLLQIAVSSLRRAVTTWQR